jgi:hypothetical protein
VLSWTPVSLSSTVGNRCFSVGLKTEEVLNQTIYVLSVVEAYEEVILAETGDEDVFEGPIVKGELHLKG